MVDISTEEGMQRALHVNSIAVWQPDGDVKACLNCGTRFDFIIRRHHCRCCGGIFCGRCCNTFLRYDMEKVKVVTRDTEMPEPLTTVESTSAPPQKYTSRHRTCISCSSTLRRAKLVQENVSIQPTTTSAVHIETSEAPPTNVKVSRIREHSRQIDGDVSEDQSILQSGDNSTDDQNDSHCPICNIDLSSLANEEEREDHIQQCIEEAENIQQHKIPMTGSSLSPDGMETSPVAKNRMLVYKIPTAKEGENVTYKECPICFEDMLPGEKVGRLECLCVFHYKCIKSWFNKKTQKMQQQQQHSTDNNNTTFLSKNFCPFHDAIY